MNYAWLTAGKVLMHAYTNEISHLQTNPSNLIKPFKQNARSSYLVFMTWKV